MAEKEDGEPGDKPGGASKKAEQEAKRVDAPTARRRQDAIGRRLRQMYEDVVSEPVPDDFLNFLQQADAQKRDAQKRGETPPHGGGPKNGKTSSEK